MEGCRYAGDLIDFFSEQEKIVPTGQVWIGSSEIIESLFGKVKHLEQDQSKGGFTSLILGAAACVGKIDTATVRQAIEQYSIKDIAFHIAREFEYEEHIVFNKQFADGQFKKTSSNEKLRGKIPDLNFTDIQYGIQKSVDFFKENFAVCRK